MYSFKDQITFACFVMGSIYQLFSYNYAEVNFWKIPILTFSFLSFFCTVLLVCFIYCRKLDLLKKCSIE